MLEWRMKEVENRFDLFLLTCVGGVAFDVRIGSVNVW